MKNSILKLFLVVTLFCASGFAFAATALNAGSTVAEIEAAIQQAGPAGYEAVAIELAEAHVPVQLILNAVAKYYGLAGVQNVANAFITVLGLQANSVNAAAVLALTSNGLDPAGYVPGTGSGGGPGGGFAGLGGGGISIVGGPSGPVSPN